MTFPTARATVTGALLAWFLVFPSLGTLQKYFGTRAALAYAIGTTALLMLLVGQRVAVASRLRAVDPAAVRWAFSALFLALAMLFALLYPLSNSGVASWLSPSGIVGGGSDRDEALNLGARALLEGRYPYYERTQLDNPISQMPGSLIFAIPFVVLGNAAWQNLVWLGALAVVGWRLLGDARAALACLVLILAVSPVVLQDFVTGGDLATNAIMVLVALVLVQATPASAAGWKRVAASVFAGLAFSSRAHFLLVLPLVAAALWRRVGAHAAALSLGVMLGTFAAVTLPFYVYDSPSFAPLIVQNKFSLFNTAIRASDLIFPGVSLIGGVAVALMTSRSPFPLWLVQCGLVLTAPAAALVALASARARWPDLAFTSYALPGLFFGVLGVAMWLWHSDEDLDQ